MRLLSHLIYRFSRLHALRFSRLYALSHRPIEIKENNIYERTDNDIFRNVKFTLGESGNENAEFRQTINDLFVEHKPSNHSFFRTLKSAPESVVKNPQFLQDLYTRYQAAMHSTRALVYRAPFLDSPSQRQRKIAILEDDDALGGKLSHHQQLEEMFRSFGCEPRQAEWFGDMVDLKSKLDAETAQFISTVEKLYVRSTGAWTIAEVLSDDWLSALADSLEPFFPDVKKAQYFDEVFTGHVEIIHMLETVALSEEVFQRHPKMVKQTIEDAKEMARALDGLWSNLEKLTKTYSENK